MRSVGYDGDGRDWSDRWECDRCGQYQTFETPEQDVCDRCLTEAIERRRPAVVSTEDIGDCPW